MDSSSPSTRKSYTTYFKCEVLKIDPRAGFLHVRKIFDSEEQTIYDFNVLFHGIKLQLSY